MRKGPPRPGDWLEQHPEPGQTFEGYVRSDPNRPGGRRTTLYLQPVGEFDETHTRLLAATAEGLGRFYALPVQTLPRIDESALPSSARRIHPEWKVPQVLTVAVRDLLRKNRPENAVAVLALTIADLWPGKGWNFVFGDAELTERVGVWSLARLGDPRKEYTLCLRRALKTATHETGHMLGILHCKAFECGMNGSNHLPEADSQPLWFCPDDAMKVCWACGVDPRSRYQRLVEFADAHALDTECRFWRKSLAALDAARLPGQITEDRSDGRVPVPSRR